MNKILLIGRLTKDAALRYNSTGDPVADISLAVDDGWGENKKTLWFRCSLWGKRAESLQQYLTKGTQVYVEGRLNHEEGNPRVYTLKDGTAASSFEVYVTDIQLLGGGKREDAEDVSFL
jgi:single-strand DNA-binding protein